MGNFPLRHLSIRVPCARLRLEGGYLSGTASQWCVREAQGHY